MTGQSEDFEQEAERAAKASGGPVREFLYLVARTRKYWMIPIFAALLVAGLLVIAGGSAMAPLIYALF